VTASWVFLALAIWGALWTLVSYRPPHHPPWFMVVGFFASWLTTEGAPIHLLVQVAGTIVFAFLGAFEAWPGWLGLAITLGSWFGLAASVKGSLGTRQVFHEALDAATTEPVGHLAPRIEWSRVFLPFHFRRRGVKRVRNLEYVPGGGKRHQLDIYHRPGDRGAPVLLQIHGGAWMISNKDEQGKPLQYRLASQGWICVAINYRLAPKAPWPAQLLDAKRALAWVRENIAEYGGDPDYIVVTGGSAGGHLSAMMGLTANDPRWQPGFEDVDTSVKAMIPFYGVFDWTNSTGLRDQGFVEFLERYVVKEPFETHRDIYELASPMSHVKADAPPALVVHGDLDTLAPVEVAREFVRRLRATSTAPVAYVELAGAHHAFDIFNSIRTLQSVAGVEQFLNWLVATYPPAARSRAGADRTDSAPPAAAVNGRTPTASTEPSCAPPVHGAPGRS
jgi:acetyl esterase/lipase